MHENPMNFPINTDESEEHGTLYIGRFVNPETMADINPGFGYGVPRTNLRAMWLQGVPCFHGPTREVVPATGLCGLDKDGNTWVFALVKAPCFAQIPLN